MNIFEIIIPVAHAAEETANSGITSSFGLDWHLFVAQLVNFGIVLFVLWKWVFTPLSKKLTERTEKIEKSLNDAERITKEKEEFEAWRNGEMSKARQEASAIVTAAQTDAVKAKDEVIQQTKEEQARLVDQAKKQIEQEKQQQLQSTKAELANLVVMASEKILRGKLDEKRDAELIKESMKSI